MLPFQIIGEFSRTVALAMRLFGQYNERKPDHSYPSVHCAVLYPGSDAGDGTCFWSDSGLCLRGAFVGLYLISG